MITTRTDSWISPKKIKYYSGHQIGYMYKYALERDDLELVWIVTHSDLYTGEKIMIALFDPNEENVASVLSDYYSDKLKGAMNLIDKMTYLVIGLNAAYKAPAEDLDELIESITKVVSCEQLLGKSGELHQDQFSALMRSMIRTCGKDFVFTKMSESSALLQQPYKTKWGL